MHGATLAVREAKKRKAFFPNFTVPPTTACGEDSSGNGRRLNVGEKGIPEMQR
jgi:hypothetical protein